MKTGNWIPIDKNIKYFMPHGRPYTKIEALISLAMDRDNGKNGSISGYAKLWGWGRKKVRKFIYDLENPEEQKRNRRGTDRAHAVTLKNNNLRSQGNTKGTEEEHLRNTTIKPNPKPKKKDSCANFDLFWQEYPKQKGKGYAEKAWKKINPNRETTAQILSVLGKAKKSADWIKEDGRYIPHPTTWLNGKGWEDTYEEVKSKPKEPVI